MFRFAKPIYIGFGNAKTLIWKGVIMRYIIDHDYHIHSQLSECSSHPEQTTENILKYAKQNNLKRICLTDHFWDEIVGNPSEWYAPQDFAHICKALPLPQDDEVEFLFGCETDFDKLFRVGVSKERLDKFDFIIIPTTHLHMPNFTYYEEDSSPESKAKLWTLRLEKLFELDLPWHKIGLAHLATPLITPTSREDYLKTLDLIPSDEMERVFGKAAELGVGIEINRDDMNFSDAEADTVLRMFRIAKAQGCKFYLGSDAHNPKGFEITMGLFNRGIDWLELTEDDKFKF